MQGGPNTTTPNPNLGLTEQIAFTSVGFSTDSNQFNPSENIQSTIPYTSFIPSSSVLYPAQDPTQLTLQLPQQPNLSPNLNSQRSLYTSATQNELIIEAVEPINTTKAISKSSKAHTYQPNSQSNHKSHQFSSHEHRVNLNNQSNSLTIVPLSSSPPLVSKPNNHDDNHVAISNQSHPLLSSFQLTNNNPGLNKQTVNISPDKQDINGHKGMVMEAENSKNRSFRSFKISWLVTFPWLYYHDRTMYCLYCLEFKKRNVFTEGSTQFKKDALNRHANSSSHRRATEYYNQFVEDDELKPEERFTYTKLAPPPSSDSQNFPYPPMFVQSPPFKPTPRLKTANRSKDQQNTISMSEEPDEIYNSQLPITSTSNTSILIQPNSNQIYSKLTSQVQNPTNISISSSSERQSKGINSNSMGQPINVIGDSIPNQNNLSWADFLVLNATFIAKHNLPLNLYEPLTHHILNMIDTFGHRKENFHPPSENNQSFGNQSNQRS